MDSSSMAQSPLLKSLEKEGTTATGTPVRYKPIERVYSECAPSSISASGSSMSKKIKARKRIDDDDGGGGGGDDEEQEEEKNQLPSSIRVYARRPKKLRHSNTEEANPSFFDSLIQRFDSQSQTPTPNGISFGKKVSSLEKSAAIKEEMTDISIKQKKKTPRNSELLKLGLDSSFSAAIDGPRTRPRNNISNHNNNNTSERKPKASKEPNNASSGVSLQTKKWVGVSFEDVDPSTFIGLKCKVFWPLDDEWYSGSVLEYNSKTYKHRVQYDDGDSESLTLSKERVKFYLSHKEMERLNLRYGQSNKEDIGLDDNEMFVLAASFDDSEKVEPGTIIWAKLTGHAVWPAVVVNESDVGVCKDLKPSQGERSVPVQFFGTHDFARVSMKQVISFTKGLVASYQSRCKKPRFRRSLEEAKMYLSEHKLPNKMLQLQNGTGGDDCESAGGEDDGSNCSGDEKTLYSKACPFEIGDLRVVSLGKIVTDSEYFHNEQYIWPEGYIAMRKFISVTDPNISASYRMEVLRDPDSKFRPLFRVTMDNGDQFKGSNPSACWNKIYRRIRKMQRVISNSGLHAEDVSKMIEKPGSYMFGFSDPKVSKLIQELSYSIMPSAYSGGKLGPKKSREASVGYRPVRVEWKDLDKCSVCYMDEEYENNLFLQCDKCRMMVHARCYGELEPVNGVLWLCNLCRPGAPESPPPCCLCPVIGGAMKPTTNGLWAHLACAIWIPETCLSDIKRMEPIDGLNRINKDRWKLLCSICGVSYGACIQCSNSTCCVAYHPLCARAAGLCVELEDEDRLHLMSFDEDEDNQCIRQHSFCKKHRQPSNECSPGENVGQVMRNCSNYSPPLNLSGCARSEPYDFLGRRGRKEPEAHAAASLKRLYVENRPYLVTGYCQNGTMENAPPSNEFGLFRSLYSFQKSKLSELETSKSVLSMAEKYDYMKETFRRRLAFGKSGIHGFGIFAKHPHRAGDMVIEYIGEIVRPSIADRRERFIYNSLVGAGTYMFRIDDERVIDATRAGSVAHLINHSCEPNCYSRVINVHGDEHIIIFAKRDINKSEELTYDYRFFSIDEQLACYCGFPRCRGVVNDTEAEVATRSVPRSKLIDWRHASQQIDRLTDG